MLLEHAPPWTTQPRVLIKRPLVELHDVEIGLACQKRLILHRSTTPSNPKNQYFFWVQYTFHPEADIMHLQARENFRNVWVGFLLHSSPVAIMIYVDTYQYGLQRLDLD